LALLLIGVYSFTAFGCIELTQKYRLDGLNKELDSWDGQYYMGEFRSLCAKEKMPELAWPSRDYIIQIARFDPSKGIPNVVDSYAKFRDLLKANGKLDENETPQLLICGHGAVDDPDASIIYDQVIKLIHSDTYEHIVNDIVVMRLPPSDQRTVFYTDTT
jgi:glycosyltransferase involved in cell wall biosynthesis